MHHINRKFGSPPRQLDAAKIKSPYVRVNDRSRHSKNRQVSKIKVQPYLRAPDKTASTMNSDPNVHERYFVSNNSQIAMAKKYVR